jgi:hypothetical protein
MQILTWQGWVAGNLASLRGFVGEGCGLKWGEQGLPYPLNPSAVHLAQRPFVLCRGRGKVITWMGIQVLVLTSL